MEGFRKKLAGSGIFAALFFAVFAILVSFHYHEGAAHEAPTHQCAVCHNSPASKVIASQPGAWVAPQQSFENFNFHEISQTFSPILSYSDPIRGPPLA